MRRDRLVLWRNMRRAKSYTQLRRQETINGWYFSNSNSPLGQVNAYFYNLGIKTKKQTLGRAQWTKTHNIPTSTALQLWRAMASAKQPLLSIPISVFRSSGFRAPHSCSNEFLMWNRIKFKRLIELSVARTGNHDIYHSLVIMIVLLLLKESFTVIKSDEDEILILTR